MSLDKFGFSKNPKEPKKSSKKTSKSKEHEEELEEPVDSTNDMDQSEDISGDDTVEKETSVVSSRKKNMKCTDAKCGYKRTLNKRDLEPDDYICKKCGKPMKLTK